MRKRAAVPAKRYLVLSAWTLSQFKTVAEDEELEMIEDLGALTAEEAVAILENGVPSRRITMFDLETFIMKVADEIEASGAGTRAEFDAEMSILCWQAFGTDDERKWAVRADEPASIPIARR